MRRDLSLAESQVFDLVIIGGGVTGAAIAWEASLRGHKVLLLEKNDFGHGTSSATSKLVHGGLRYLAKLELSIVRESLKERRFLEENLGHLCFPMPFIMPIYKHSKTSKWKIKLGLWLYDMLSYDRNDLTDPDKSLPGHRWLSPKEVAACDPNIPQEDLKGAFLYYDVLNKYPHRSNLAFIKSACQAGAVALNHCEVTGFAIDDEGLSKSIQEVQVRDCIDGRSFAVRAKGYINAAGPWADKLINEADNATGYKIQRSKGIHILLPKQLGNYTVAFETKDKKHFFLIPWLNYTLLGTTDTPCHESPDQVKASKAEIDDLLQVAADHYNLVNKEVMHSYAGIRPLLFDANSAQPTYSLSRKHEIIDHAKQNNISRFISVIGGKWTTSRALAEQTISRAEKLFQLKRTKSTTISTKLVGSHYEGRLADYQSAVLNSQTSVSEVLTQKLLDTYGSETDQILALIDKNPDLATILEQEYNTLKAEVHYAVFYESSLTLDDLFYRRLNIGNLGNFNPKAVQAIAAEQARCLNWSEEKLEMELAQLFENRNSVISAI